MEDTEIIDLYFKRCESAVSVTAEKYGAYLNQIAYNILRVREDTEEIVADTYLAAWNTIPPQVPSILRHFLSRITRNLAFDRLDYLMAGRRNSHMTILLSELETCVPDWSQEPDRMMDSQLVSAVLNRFLGEQQQMDCAVFLSRYYYGMTVGEICRRYDLTEGTVKYRLSSLRRKLRRYLEKEGITV